VLGRERLRPDCVAPIAAIEVVMGRLTRAEEYARLAIDLAHRHGWEALGPAPGARVDG
jgi:hypothetical protein